MPESISGSVARTRAPGFSFSAAHAISGTKATWRLPSTVASPAPTSSIAWCQQTRSIAKKTPAIAASRRSLAGRGPWRRSSARARKKRIGTA